MIVFNGYHTSPINLFTFQQRLWSTRAMPEQSGQRGQHWLSSNPDT